MIKLYIANLGKYNEGELKGEWIDLPKTEEEIKQFLADKVGINAQYEEWAIHDFETDLGLEIGEYSNIYELNEIAEQTESFEETELKVLKAFLEDGCEFEDAIEHIENDEYYIYSDCNDMSDVAYQVVEESCMLENVPENITRYFDYEAYGRDLDIEGKFYYVDGDYIELTY